MKVQVKLFATLQRYAPAGQFAGEPFDMELPEGGTIAMIVEQLAIRPHEVKVTFVNGRARAEVYRLKEGDEVGIFPPVGGG
ncbi:MAG: MoaD/ThiS family protein [Anaerolineae bacterium]|jgi:molybdopterin converting factor small subunit|nr:MoaD/ThiS family protein [Anaerolineae bacterium]